eukprot:CAMPEP_0171685226 /NCGR_PEP_ID=MMETSP0991-20121206/2137_1 /TAXON_ID=483369 /ORGANISM="non described non described, Strain CCMP2098" /LENGTH=542 /DNA_ID=CAMNT_0012272863 /DNA_START=179 /DNA_END=1807 /DNA_ORIENTATION=-
MNQVTVLAGGGQRTNPGGFLYRDGAVRVALFNSPQGIAVTKDGDLIVADSNRIRKIDNHGQVTTVAGSGSFAFGDGQSSGAHFKNPRGVVVTEEGLIVVADSKNHRIRTVTPEGIVTTLAGSGVAGFADGPGMQAMFDFPRRVAIDRNGNVIVADTNNNRIRIVTQAGQVTTLAGSGNGDGDGSLAHFNQPSALTVDRAGSIIVADSINQRIRKISSGGKVSTVAGNGVHGCTDGPGASASFCEPSGLAVDGDGNIVVADCGNHRIRMISSDGNVTTIAGSGSAGFANGAGTAAATFRSPIDADIDGDGNIIVADFNNCIRKIAAQLTPPQHSKLPLRLASTHAHEMAEMLEDPTFADVIFQVEETKISKAVLVSRCVYFKTMFTSGFKEGNFCPLGGGGGATNVAIGETTAPAFKALLRYIYTDVLEFDDKDVLNVMAKAKEMQLERVYSHTVWYCHQNVCVGNAVLWLIEADELKLDHLRELTLRFLVKNFGAVRDAAGDSVSGSRFELLQEKPVLLMEVVLAINVEGHTGIGSNKRRRA